MSNGPEEYAPRDGGPHVLAMQVKPDNWVAAATWSSGVMLASDPGNPGSQAVALGSLTSIASLGWWIVKPEGGSFQPMEPSQFQQNYDAVES